MSGMTVGELSATFTVDAAQAEAAMAQQEAAMRALERNTAETAASIRRDLEAALRRLPTVRIDANSTPLDERLLVVRQELKDLSRERVGVTISTEDAQAKVDALSAELVELNRANPSPRVELGTRQAYEALDALQMQLTQLAHEDAALVVHVDTERARAELEAVAAEAQRVAAEDPHITVDADTERARVELEAIAEEARRVGAENPRITVRTDTSDVSKAKSDVSALGGVLSSVGSGLSAFGGQAAMGLGMLGGAAPVIAGVAAALVNILPAAGTAATGLLMVASAGAAIKIGTSGIGSAIQAAFAPPAGGASAAVNSAQQVANAQLALKDTITNTADANVKAARAVGDAQRTLADDVRSSADAQVQAARSVAMAERTLADDQKAARQAQLDLTAARNQAKQDLEDLNNQVIDAANAQRGQLLQVQQAKITLDQTMRSPQASQAAREQAQLSYDEAVQQLSEQGLALDRLKAKQATASKAGVDGSALVVAAQDKVASANRTVGDQSQAVADAQVNAARSVEAALRKVADQTRAVGDAQEQQAKTAYQGAEAITKAEQALAQAHQSAAAGANALNAALAKLSPNARAFVQEIIALKPQLEGLKLAVQDKLFQGLAGTLGLTAREVLPALREGLVGSAGQLNVMASGAMMAAGNLGQSGVLGRALASANIGLGNLAGIPGQIVTGFGQIAAAAGPAFDRITGGAGRLATTISEKLSAAFSSGGMGKAIDLAVGLIGQLGDVVVNVGKILGDVLGAAAQTSGGFVGTLVKISGAMAAAFATPAVQSGLQALFGVMGTLASTVAPLLGQALQVVGPVLAALGPPVQVLIQALGAGGLSPIIAALGPVLLVAAKAVGQLVIGASPLLGLVGTLVSALLPSLTPLLAGAGLIFQQLSPLVQALSGALAAALGPILAQLPALITPFVTILTDLTGALLPVLTQLITQLPLASLGQSFAQIAIALTPLLAQLAVLVGDQLRTMMPLFGPIIVAVAQLAAIFAGQLARVIQSVVIPTIQAVTDLLHGNFSGAVDAGKTALSGLVSFVTDEFTKIPQAVLNILGDLASALFTAGSKIIGGLIDGIKSKVGDVKDAVGSVLSGARNLLPFSPAKEGPFSGSGWSLYSGQSISHALADGILGGQGRVKAATASLMSTAHGGLGGAMGGQFAMAGGGAAGAFGGGLHIQNYHESASGNARSTAEELLWLGKGRG